MSGDGRETAARLFGQAREIMRRWEERVRTEIPASNEQRGSVLRNNLERLLAEVARTLAPGFCVTERIEGLTISEDHGSGRALLAEYRLAEVFLEYRWLRKTILEVLDEGGVLTPHEREQITDALEESMQDAGSQYAMVRQEEERRRGDEARRTAEALHTAYERERRIVQVLQRPLLRKVTEDAVPGLSLAVAYEPALAEAEVGGDFFDVIPLPDGRAALVVGDTCGKGLEAAAHNTHASIVLRAFLAEDPGHPGRVLSRLNRAVCDTLRSVDPDDFDTFIVVALLIVDPFTGDAMFASAGAEPLLLVRAGGEAEVMERPGLPLGIERETNYPDAAMRLEPGDTAVLVTDGITEARYDGALLGYAGMQGLARQSLRASTLQEAGEAIVTGARAFAHGPLSDDACLLLARRR